MRANRDTLNSSLAALTRLVIKKSISEMDQKLVSRCVKGAAAPDIPLKKCLRLMAWHEVQGDRQRPGSAESNHLLETHLLYAHTQMAAGGRPDTEILRERAKKLADGKLYPPEMELNPFALGFSKKSLKRLNKYKKLCQSPNPPGWMARIWTEYNIGTVLQREEEEAKPPPPSYDDGRSRTVLQMQMEQLEMEVEAMNGELSDNSKETIEELTGKNLRLQDLLDEMLYELCEFCAEASDGNPRRCPKYTRGGDPKYDCGADEIKRCTSAKYGTCSTWGAICAAKQWNLYRNQEKQED